MGLDIYRWYVEKCPKRYKIAFYSAFIIGLATHFYKFTNTLLNHDSVLNFYDPQNMTRSGRWFLSAACSLSSYYDLPWVNGILSLLFISLTAVVIVKLFNIENPGLIIISGGLLAAFPSVTATFFYEFTADGYMLAMLMSALGVYFIRFGENRVSRLILGGVLICLACGTYQAYVSFAIVLAIFIIMWELFEGKRSTGEIMRWIGTRLVVLASAFVLYYIIWRISLAVQGVSPTNYLGIDKVGTFFPNIGRSFYEMVKSVTVRFMKLNQLFLGITPYSAMQGVFCITALAIVVVSAVRSGVIRQGSRLVLLVICIFFIPVGVGIWQLTSETLVYHLLMLQSVSLIYIFAAFLCDRWMNPGFKKYASLLFASIILMFSIVGNQGYHAMERANRESYATAVEMSIRIHEIQSEYDTNKAVFLGEYEYDESKEGADMLIGQSYMPYNICYYCVNEDKAVIEYLDEYFNVDLTWGGIEAEERMMSDPEVSDEMDIWPAADSIRVIDDIIVVKLGEIK